jgi:hypothetical protein
MVKVIGPRDKKDPEEFVINCYRRECFCYDLHQLQRAFEIQWLCSTMANRNNPRRKRSMKKDIVKKWIAELKKFTKQDECLHLRFPMRMESAKGDLYSPEGLLCELHSVETGGKTKWQPEKPEKKGQLRGYMTYLGEAHFSP